MSQNKLIKDMFFECKELNLLYVEDDAILAETTHETLKQFFNLITVCNNGKDGLKAFKNGNFDIVLTDIMMPVLDGKDMSRQIRELNPDQAIIVMSAHEDADYLMELIEIGIHKFVPKPSSLEQLFRAILISAININNAKKVSKLTLEIKQDLAQSKEILRTIIDTVPVRIFWKDKNSIYLGCNTLFAQDAGFKDQFDIIGKNDFDLSWKNEAQSYVDDDVEVIRSGEERLYYEEQQTHPDGSVIWLNTSKTPLLGENKEIIGVLGTYTDVTKQKEAMTAVQKAKDELGYQAEHDILTGLPNRTLFLDRLHQAIKKASRSDKKVGVVFIDLDRFKEINDSFGHDTGDKVVQLFGRRLSKQLRNVDSIARFGGDEFIVLLEEITGTHDVTEVLQKLMKSMETSINVNNHSLYLTLSAGISIYPDDGNTAEILIRNSDTAMYRAKDSGRNTYSFYTKEMTQESFSHMIMSKNIRQALDNKEFLVYYQPQIDGITGKIKGMEALVRWISPTEGFISPADFIPVAEDSGLIDKIGHFVFEEAASQIVKWYEKGYNPGCMAINLSTVELQQENFVHILQDKLLKLKCKPEWIELEITEGYTMKHPEEAIEMLESIKEIGINLSIDDFGTGYSSLSYLKRLPIHKLKIDQAFVSELPGNMHDVAIVESIIALAKAMKFDVIAEGVETVEQHDFLIQNGCSNIQGYYYAKPMPADEMERFMQEF